LIRISEGDYVWIGASGPPSGLADLVVRLYNSCLLNPDSIYYRLVPGPIEQDQVTPIKHVAGVPKRNGNNIGISLL